MMAVAVAWPSLPLAGARWPMAEVGAPAAVASTHVKTNGLRHRAPGAYAFAPVLDPSAWRAASSSNGVAACLQASCSNEMANLRTSSGSRAESAALVGGSLSMAIAFAWALRKTRRSATARIGAAAFAGVASRSGRGGAALIAAAAYRGRDGDGGRGSGRFSKFGELGAASPGKRRPWEQRPGDNDAQDDRYHGRRRDDDTDSNWRDPRVAKEEWRDPYAAERPKPKKHFHRGGAWRKEKEARELASMEGIPIASGQAPVYAAANTQEEDSDGSTTSSSTPGGSSSRRYDGGIIATMDLLERARLAAEEGWDERRWQDLSDGTWSDQLEREIVPMSMRERLNSLATPQSIKDYIEENLLGNRKMDRLPKNERRKVIFSGEDPAHNGKRHSTDDGTGTSLGRMAVAVHGGFLRQRATCHCGGMRDSPGEFPLAERPEVAFIGASNVGKSSLLNAITRTMKLAEARDEPGVTRSIGWYKCSKLPIDILDLPGYGQAKGADFAPLVIDFIARRKALRTIYILIDARSGIKPVDWEFLKMLGNEGPEKVFVLTKCDLRVPRGLGKMATATLEDIQCVPKASKRLIMVSARLGHGLHDLRQDLCRRSMEWAAKAKKAEERRRMQAEAEALLAAPAPAS